MIRLRDPATVLPFRPWESDVIRALEDVEEPEWDPRVNNAIPAAVGERNMGHGVLIAEIFRDSARA